MLRTLCILLTGCVGLTSARAQPTIFSADSAAPFARALAEKLPPANIYLIGQLHNNKANTLLEKELLFTLNHRQGLRYDLLEYSHSAAFLLNEYLATGNDSLLRLINSVAPFSVIKAIKGFNDTVSDNRKIRFYGIDFEGRSQGWLAQKVLARIARRLPDTTSTLYNLLKACEQANGEALPAQMGKVQAYLQRRQQEARAALKDNYLDCWLIVNAQFNWSPKRDKAMYQSFRFLYQELLSRDGQAPSFFSSFGYDHLHADNKAGIMAWLKNDRNSPVRNSVITLGVQYQDCYFEGNKYVASFGSLSNACNQPALAALLANIDTAGASLRYLGIQELKQHTCGQNIIGLEGVVVIQGFRSNDYWLWE